MKYEINEQVVVKAEDGSTGVCTVVSISESTVVLKHGDKDLTVKREWLDKAVVGESSHHPTAAVYRNQLVRVYEGGSNTQVDTGLVTDVTPEAVFVNGEAYAHGSHDFLILTS